MSDSVWPHRQQPTWLPRPWDSPGKNTGVGCHFLLQCMKVKSESEVAQSYPTLRDPMDCSPQGSSAHGIFQAGVLEWGAIVFFHRIFFFQLEFDFHSQYSPLKRSTGILPANHVTSTRREPIPCSYTLLLPLLLWWISQFPILNKH